jgi:hypothetical protein
MVGTVKKSMAAIASRWLCRKASQRLADPGLTIINACCHPDQNLRTETQKRLIERCQSWSGMSALQYRELLAKGEVFEKQPTMSVEEAPDRSRQEPSGVYHVPVLSHSACGWQHLMLLKSQADRILGEAQVRPVPRQQT